MTLRIARRLKRLARNWLFPSPAPAPRELHEWAIGIYTGATPWQLLPVADRNPVLTRYDVRDTRAVFVADPFMLRVSNAWHMFFEVMNWNSGKGEIALASSADGLHWQYQQIVLSEPFHLSYPYVFAWADDYYMIPESWKAGAVRLYRASHFPTQWTYVATLLELPYITDCSLFHDGDRWWLFGETGANFRCDTLRLYTAPDLRGPWIEHPHSPIVRDNPHSARPAGRILTEGGRVLRFAQDCAPCYGLQVFAFAITELTPERYSEEPLGAGPILSGSGVGWNSHGMHHIDAHRREDGSWIACVDGWRSVREEVNAR